jgi:hypothetical protein
MLSAEVVFLHADGTDLNWPIASIARSLRRSSLPDILFQGLIGAPVRSATVPAIYADLAALTLPGLGDVGFAASLLPLPEPKELRDALQGLGRIPIYGFAGEPFKEEVDGVNEEDQEDASRARVLDDGGDRAEPELVEIDRARTLVDTGLLCALTDSNASWEDVNGQSHSASTELFRTRFTRIVEMSLQGKAATRRVALVAAVRRATVFALAYPNRFLTESEDDAELRAQAAGFLTLAAGKQRDPISRRWQLAGEYLRAGDVFCALDELYDATLRSLNLPASLYNALALVHDEPLTDLERRELIYLARAGTRDLKVLAARSLSAECSHYGVRHTLEQLTINPDPLVRAAAAVALDEYATG